RVGDRPDTFSIRPEPGSLSPKPGSLPAAPIPRRRSQYVTKGRLETAKSAIAEPEQQECANPECRPGGGMLKSAVIKRVLITPDHIAERVEVDDRSKQVRNPTRQIEDRHQVGVYQRQHLNDIFEIAEERPGRGEQKSDTRHGSQLACEK